MRPQFRILCTPPWARTAMLRYFTFIESQLAEEITAHPQFVSGGPALRLQAIHSGNKLVFDAFLLEAQDNFCTQNPREAEAWRWLIIQHASRQYRPDVLRTPVRPAATGLEEVLQQNSNRVNARFFDHNGSLYIVFYNRGLRIEQHSSRLVSTRVICRIRLRL